MENKKAPGQNPLKLCYYLERKTGFEPATPTLARLCSTPELLPLLSTHGGGTQNRTGDTRIFSPLLYHLSYPALLSIFKMAGPTRLELATFGVTGRHSNRLSYDPAFYLVATKPILPKISTYTLRFSSILQ